MNNERGSVQCDSHHWVSTNVPGLLTRWVIQCSICGSYNVEEMNRAVETLAPQAMSDQSSKTNK